MSIDPKNDRLLDDETPTPTEDTSAQPTDLTTTEPAEPVNEIALRLASIEAAPTLSEKSNVLWALPAKERNVTLGLLPATTVAALIQSDPDKNTGLIANLPARKFTQILGLGSFEQGRQWLERAVGSGSLAGAILPSLMTSRDLAEMLLTSPEFRRHAPKLLNYERASGWRQLLTTAEYHANADSILMSDTDELLVKANFKDKQIKAILQSLMDFVPELYLETMTLAVERLKYAEDRPYEMEDISVTPFGQPEMSIDGVGGASHAPIETDEAGTPSPLSDLIPEGGDPVFALATAGLTSARKADLEEQLKTLLRQEILATASFAQTDMERAAGRVLFYLRAGLELYGPSVEDSTRALELHNLNEIGAIGARAAESFRQKSLALAGQRDWLDSRQRQFLDAMKQPEAGLHPDTREAVLWLAGKAKQERADWHPTPLEEVRARISEIGAWAALARAAFGTPERVHAIFNTQKTRTAAEALRRTVVALTLYRRWEPELIRPSEDIAAFKKQYGKGKRHTLDEVRRIILDALDQTPAAAWKPSDAKSRAKDLLLRAVEEVDTMAIPAPAKH